MALALDQSICFAALCKLSIASELLNNHTDPSRLTAIVMPSVVQRTIGVSQATARSTVIAANCSNSPPPRYHASLERMHRMRAPFATASATG